MSDKLDDIIKKLDIYVIFKYYHDLFQNYDKKISEILDSTVKISNLINEKRKLDPINYDWKSDMLKNELDSKKLLQKLKIFEHEKILFDSLLQQINNLKSIYVVKINKNFHKCDVYYENFRNIVENLIFENLSIIHKSYKEKSNQFIL